MHILITLANRLFLYFLFSLFSILCLISLACLERAPVRLTRLLLLFSGISHPYWLAAAIFFLFLSQSGRDYKKKSAAAANDGAKAEIKKANDGQNRTDSKRHFEIQTSLLSKGLPRVKGTLPQ